MNSTPDNSPKQSDWQFDPDPWTTMFTSEMRRLGASGREIGEAWAVVSSHCRDASLSKPEAFGDPVDYAAQIRDGHAAHDPLLLYLTLPALLALLGWMGTLMMPWRWGREPIAVSWGSLAFISWTALVMLTAAPLWRSQRHRPGRQWAIALGAPMAHNLLAPLLRAIDAVAFTSPAWLAWTTIALSCLLGTIGCLRAAHDRVIDPRTGLAPNDLPAFWWYALGCLSFIAPGAIMLLRLTIRQ